MKLVVGLGNPGRRYVDTRHNMGFRVVGELARRYALSSPRARFHGEVTEAVWGDVRCLLLCPMTYMNRSGMSVLAACDFYKMDLSDLLVVCDDFNLPLARLRVRAKGSSGGQKGLEDTIRCLGTEQFPRLRIGIGSPPHGWDAADFVLSRFSDEELPLVKEVIVRAADAVVTWTHEGIENCMSQYNAD
jgi:peptidyl-tRNA hydrolase, PTH1 family